MERKRDIDSAIADLATRQGGAVSRAQLFALGLGRGAIDARLRRGLLHRLHRGVYLVGHRHTSHRTHDWAALLACGEGAVLSHRSAAAYWGMLPAPSTVVHVTVPTVSGRRSRRPIIIHRVPELTGELIATREGMPVTSMARTLLDIAATSPTRVVEQALDGADTARVLDMGPIDRIAPLGSRAPGAPHLHRVLLTHVPGTTISRSDYEEGMLALCRAHGLPQPVMNRHIGPWEADFLWPTHRLVVEVQSTKFHATSQRIARLLPAESMSGLRSQGTQR